MSKFGLGFTVFVARIGQAHEGRTGDTNIIITQLIGEAEINTQRVNVAYQNLWYTL